MSYSRQERVKVLSELIWRKPGAWPEIERWLQNFQGHSTGEPGAVSACSEERRAALYLLGEFLFFGYAELKALLRSLYWQFVVRRQVSLLLDGGYEPLTSEQLGVDVGAHLTKVRFLALGNPSESGTHLLYHFRQINHLQTEQFVNAIELFAFKSNGVSLVDPTVERYVFVDDFCGTGTQALRYAAGVVPLIRSRAPTATVEYYTLFGTDVGVDNVRSNGQFNHVDVVCELSDANKLLHETSVVLAGLEEDRLREVIPRLAMTYGKMLMPSAPLGYKDSQLMLGFLHNTPNNTLPLFWATSNADPEWYPLFPRYRKLA